jgi:putative alpha-1,2-mannosidase
VKTPLHLLLSLLAIATPAAAKQAGPPVDMVDPFMGTRGDRGQLSPAAAAPFGMVQLAPDTDPANHIGYDRAAPMLKGFSQTRAQGVGCGGGGGDLLTSVAYTDEAGPAPIDRSSERAGAGWYHVRYGRTAIIADLAAGQSVSISRFIVSRSGSIEVALDPRHSYAKHVSHQWLSTSGGDLRLNLANSTVCNRGVYHLALAGRLVVNGRVATATGTMDARDVLRFTLAVRAGDRIELRVALSTVDAESAGRTLARELGDMSFDRLVGRTRADWNARLSAIAFDAPVARRRLFYTALFRALQMPARVDDSAGAFRGSDGRLQQAPRGHHRYAGWSLWDNYRTQVPLVALVAPDVAGDIADSLVLLFQSDKPQWASATEPFLSVRTEHAGIALLDLYRKHLGSVDPAVALEAMAAETTQLPQETPDQKLELAYDQWAVAQLAQDTGHADVARDFMTRALGYRPMWQEVFRDLGADADTVKARGLYQGTLWQYRWAPVFDLDWLRNTALGDARFKDELGRFFDGELFNMTNEPDIHAPWLFALTDDPARMDRLVAQLRDAPINHWYENQRKYTQPIRQKSFALDSGFAEGMDDDGGAMSAWYVWASIGLYPLVPGDPFYIVTPPAARQVSIRLPEGRTFRILRTGAGEALTAIRQNDTPLAGRRLTHASLLRGGTVKIEMGR